LTTCTYYNFGLRYCHKRSTFFATFIQLIWFVGANIVDCSLRLVVTVSSWVLYAHIVDESIVDTYSEKAEFLEQ